MSDSESNPQEDQNEQESDQEQESENKNIRKSSNKNQMSDDQVQEDEEDSNDEEAKKGKDDKNSNDQKNSFFDNAFSDNQNNSNQGSFQFNFGEFPAGDNKNDGNADGAFQFSFNDFPQYGEAQTGASFTFDANDEASGASEEDKLYEKFISLIKSPCFDYTGRPLIEFFKHEDPTDTAASAFSLLVGNK